MPPHGTSAALTGDTFGDWFRDRGVRETIESVVVAIMLALLFRSFEAEAFIIPTGSMAPSLQGEHIDVACPKCDYQYRAGASNEQIEGKYTVSTFCPICRYNLRLRRAEGPSYIADHDSFDGDRILANKYIYDFTDPLRWDVIIFKNPNNPKQNYIKRCVGLENEGLAIEYGDIFTYDSLTENVAQRRIARKPPAKLWYMLQLVDDTDYIPDDLHEAGWPLRWNEHESPNTNWNVELDEGVPRYSIAASDGTHWLRYKHIVPRWFEWDQYILSKKLPPRIKDGYAGELIADYYAYNHRQREAGQPSVSFPNVTTLPENFFDADLGLHWVGDLCLEARVDTDSESGTIKLDLVEGGAHFICDIDLSSGKVSITSDSADVQFTGQTDGKCSIRGAGTYQLRFANCDNRLVLWVNRKPVRFGKTPYMDYERPSGFHPVYSEAEPGDAQPAGIAIADAAATVDQLRIYRDVYYRAVTLARGQSNQTHEYGNVDVSGFGSRRLRDAEVRAILTDPDSWSTELATQMFDARSPEDDLSLFLVKGEGSVMPLGDNSPYSLDARMWGGPPYVEREYISGRAMLIYWPHSWNKPPFWPNFKRMGFIH